MENITATRLNMNSHMADFAKQNVALTTTSAVALASLFFFLVVLRKPISRVPGPWYSRWTGLPLIYAWVRGVRAAYVHDLHKKYGPIVRIAPNEVSIRDIDAMKTVYSVKETYLKPQWYKDFTIPTDNMFNTADIGYHRKSRRMLAAGMADTSIHKLSPRVGGHVDFAVEKMKQENETRGAVDVYKWWLFMATDIIVEFTYGESFHMLEGGERNEYSFFLEHTGMFGIYRAISPFLTNIVTRLPFKLFQDMGKALNAMIKASGDGVAIHKKIVEESGEDDTEKTFFTNLFKMQSENDADSHAALLSEGQLYIIAGSDTTANTLTYLIWAMCKNHKLKAELLAELQALPTDYTDTDLRQLDLLNRAVKETLRMYAATPEGLPRKVPVGGAELCGYQLDEGTVVGAQSYSMHRDPAVFDRPEEYDPSRWIEPTKEMTDSFMAFGRGSRICLGLHLAYTELRMGTARFFRTFPNATVSTREGMSEDDMTQSSFFIMSPKGHRCLIDVN